MQDQKLGGKGKRKQGVGEQARYLAAMGLNAKDIADITGAPVSSIRTLLTPSRSRYMGRRLLDERLLAKLEQKLSRPVKSVRESVSKKAAKLGISPQAALILFAKEHDIGTAIYQRKLDPMLQAEVRTALPSVFANRDIRPIGGKISNSKSKAISPPKHSPRKQLKNAIEYLIQDPKLLDRCQDMLMASKNFDRAINQATQVLEDRIRRKAEPSQRLVGEPLVNYAFKESLSETVLQIAGADPEDQRGYTQIFRGIVSAFRNKTHHHIIDFSREDAMRVCGFIDVLLRAVDNSKKLK